MQHALEVLYALVALEVCSCLPQHCMEQQKRARQRVSDSHWYGNLAKRKIKGKWKKSKVDRTCFSRHQYMFESTENGRSRQQHGSRLLVVEHQGPERAREIPKHDRVVEWAAAFLMHQQPFEQMIVQSSSPHAKVTFRDFRERQVAKEQVPTLDNVVSGAAAFTIERCGANVFDNVPERSRVRVQSVSPVVAGCDAGEDTKQLTEALRLDRIASSCLCLRIATKTALNVIEESRDQSRPDSPQLAFHTEKG
ncbi:hypothetical protein FI667_g1810, partial [Globisporangium splendens]